MTQNGGTHAVKACAIPFRADWDRSRPAGYLATADHIALSDREVPGERAEPPYLYRQVRRKRFDQGLWAVAARVLGVAQPAPCPPGSCRFCERAGGSRTGREPGRRSNAASLSPAAWCQPVVDHFWVTCCGHRAGMAELL